MAWSNGHAAVLILGAPNTGKSRLAWYFLQQGWRLIGDDGVYSDGKYLYAPLSPYAGCIALRDIGIIAVPYIKKARLTTLIYILK